jgi:hypothetical protein
MNSPNIDNDIAGQNTTFRKSWRLLRANMQFRITWRIFLVVLAIYLIPTLFLGIPFLLISVGIFHILVQLSPFWTPARRTLGRILGISETVFPLSRNKASAWLIISRSILSLPYMAMVGFGISLLIKYGFLELNIIHMILSH